MIIGDKQKFAVEINVLDTVDGWIFGVLLFWIAGIVVGDPEEKTVDLKGCINWVRDFLGNARNRKEDELFEMDKKRAFLLLCPSVIQGNQDTEFVKGKYEDAFSRFHISHLGMTSFDDVNILLVENSSGSQRCIWQQGENEVQDATFEEGEIRAVMTDLVQWFDMEQKA